MYCMYCIYTVLPHSIFPLACVSIEKALLADYGGIPPPPSSVAPGTTVMGRRPAVDELLGKKKWGGKRSSLSEEPSQGQYTQGNVTGKYSTYTSTPDMIYPCPGIYVRYALE